MLVHLYSLTFFKGSNFPKGIGEVRSIIPQHVHVMALTATATREVGKNVMKVLGMSAPSCRVINISPEKANIFLAVREKVCVKEYVQRVASVLMQKQIHSEKMLIFCRRYEDCYEFYRTFKTILGNQLLLIYHSSE